MEESDFYFGKSDCCEADRSLQGICRECGEHCEELEDE